MKKGTIIYVGDPMCSWCWGIAQELTELRKNYESIFQFELILGGLRPGGGDAWTPKFTNFLREHWHAVGAKSGQAFSFDLLDWPEFNYDTEPACRAVRIIRDLAPDHEFNFFKAVQKRFYVDNENPNLVDFYQPLCEAIGVDFESFKQAFEQDDYREKTKEDFNKARSMGINGFPTVVLKTEENLVAIAMGFATAQQMSARLDNLLTASN